MPKLKRDFWAAKESHLAAMVEALPPEHQQRFMGKVGEVSKIHGFKVFKEEALAAALIKVVGDKQEAYNLVIAESGIGGVKRISIINALKLCPIAAQQVLFKFLRSHQAKEEDGWDI